MLAPSPYSPRRRAVLARVALARSVAGSRSCSCPWPLARPGSRALFRVRRCRLWSLVLSPLWSRSVRRELGYAPSTPPPSRPEEAADLNS